MTTRIEIAGSLASGKTTLCQKLQDHFAAAVYEDFSNNPYMDLAARDPGQYGLRCQEWFVENKIEMLASAVAANPGGRIISDFSLATDRAYITHYLNDKPDWIAALNERLDRGVTKIGKPDALIYLHCPADEQLRRIAERSRAFEQNLGRDFVNAINHLVDGYVGQARADGVRIITVNTGRNRLESPAALRNLLNLIR